MERENCFSVTVAIEEEEGKFYWTSLPEHQHITFIETLNVIQKYKYWVVYIQVLGEDGDLHTYNVGEKTI